MKIHVECISEADGFSADVEWPVTSTGQPEYIVYTSVDGCDPGLIALRQHHLDTQAPDDAEDPPGYEFGNGHHDFSGTPLDPELQAQLGIAYLDVQDSRVMLVFKPLSEVTDTLPNLN
jgi:hypothetical protein